MQIAITWQPEIAEAGQYFLTIVQHDDAGDIPGIMAKAFEVEELEPGQPYDLCSVLAISGDMQVVW